MTRLLATHKENPMTSQIKNPEKDAKLRNKNQNIEQNRKHSGQSRAQSPARNEGNRDGKH
jgi:hypothetical protein